MHTVAIRYCISEGPCMILDVIDVSKINEHMAKLSVKSMPEGNILTRGVDCSVVCAHDINFNLWDLNYRERAVEEFVALYRTTLFKFFTVTMEKNKAVLNKIDIELARKVFDDLPLKIFSTAYVFSSDDGYDFFEMEENRVMKEDLASSEADRIESLKGPHDRFLDDSEVSARRN